MSEAAFNVNGNGSGETATNQLPTWLSKVSLVNAVQAQIGEFEKIISILPIKESQIGENYSSLLLRLNVDVQLHDGSIKSTTFVLKAQHSNDVMAKIIDMLQLFHKEEQMYHKIIPKYEKLYQDAGKTIKFAPKAFKFDRDLGVDYILLEDLHNCKNANRVVGFDMLHMKEVLRKLAAFHAASACYVEHYGMFGEDFTVGVFSEANRSFLKEIDASDAFLGQLKKWKNCQQYYAKLEDSDQYLVDRLLQDQKVNSCDFNVLNHGDCWANNILFQYDAFGKIKETYFIDFQVGKYGSPAFDLYYLILTTAAMDIKTKQFDYMIRYYYDHLIENLTLLQYHRPLPKLRNIHKALLNNGLGAYMVVSKVLPVVMLEKSATLNIENLFVDESKLKLAMYTNPKYVQAMAEILPWLDNRGLLDWKK